jgi:hypothetical protein
VCPQSAHKASGYFIAHLHRAAVHGQRKAAALPPWVSTSGPEREGYALGSRSFTSAMAFLGRPTGRDLHERCVLVSACLGLPQTLNPKPCGRGRTAMSGV